MINDMNVKLVFTGAQGTGKTTILKEFENNGKEVITEVVRKLAKKGVKINKDGDEEGQKKIFKAYEKALKEKDNFISDRCLIDVTAYTMYLVNKGAVSKDLLDSQMKSLKKFVKNNQDFIYCYFPIEFPVVPDGTRSEDEEFRKEIDSYIKNILAELQMPFVIVKGTVEERVRIVDYVYKWLELGQYLFGRSR